VAGDALVVVDEVAAAVQHELAAVDLDRSGMMRRVPVHDVHSTVDEPMGEPAVSGGHLVPPVGAPVDGDDDYVAVPPHTVDLGDDVGGTVLGEVREEVDA
jgi:hypothetical protein